MANATTMSSIVEGGLLTRLDIPRYCRTMQERGINALGASAEKGWLETGLVFFDGRLPSSGRGSSNDTLGQAAAGASCQVVLSELLGDELYLQLGGEPRTT